MGALDSPPSVAVVHARAPVRRGPAVVERRPRQHLTIACFNLSFGLCMKIKSTIFTPAVAPRQSRTLVDEWSNMHRSSRLNDA